jgi:hypothetical protein
MLACIICTRLIHVIVHILYMRIIFYPQETQTFEYRRQRVEPGTHRSTANNGQLEEVRDSRKQNHNDQ